LRRRSRSEEVGAARAARGDRLTRS